ncbi:flagella synthesis protein FlgN [Pseudomonas sp. ok272]|uniref:flagellar protein FlgN n=1 Tax=unclassified Pseudomonas TaxID=196821 RepID=UPI0008C22B9B|nr:MULTISPECIES: flagellar protein FlgN [unclassified Pseudomonas]SEM63193.1 flagella synthesis protein FlgN [Pseudomonas sp. ok272]SFM46842.1 flagella synthesis protein FlgN [Pseudomonas sp. ok602]
MSKREQLLKVVEQDVQLDCTDYLSLRDLMQGLYQQLLERNSPQIDQLNAQVVTLIDQVRLRAQRRSKILTAFAFAPDNAALQQLFLQFPPSRGDALRHAWAQLAQLVAQCKQLNERNGKLLAMHNDILSQLLGDGRDAPLYTPQFF